LANIHFGFVQMSYILWSYSIFTQAAGAAALLWSHFPLCTNTQIRYALAYTAVNFNSRSSKSTNSKCDDHYGYGIVQTKAAYDFLKSHNCVGAIWGQSKPNGNCTSIDVEPVSNIKAPYRGTTTN
jgi:serine protease